MPLIDWWRRAKCRDADTNLFFDLKNPTPALEYCYHCPVQNQCRDYMREIRPEYGIWAGVIKKPSLKQCGGCHQILPATSFTAGQPGRDGSRTYCKDCHRIKSQEYRKRKEKAYN